MNTRTAAPSVTAPRAPARRWNTRRRTLSLWGATALAWTGLVVDVLPWGPDMSPDMARLAIVAAICGPIVLAVLYVSRPVLEVFDMGRAAGKREAKIEAATKTTVVPFRGRRDDSGLSRLG